MTDTLKQETPEQLAEKADRLRLDGYMKNVLKKVMSELDDSDDDYPEDEDESSAILKVLRNKKGVEGNIPSFIGQINVDHDISRGAVTSGILKGAFVMLEYPNHAFVGIKKARPYFEYTIKGPIENSLSSSTSYADVSIVNVLEYTTTPLAPTVQMIATILSTELVLEPGEAEKIACEVDAEYETKRGADGGEEAGLVERMKIIVTALNERYPEQTVVSAHWDYVANKQVQSRSIIPAKGSDLVSKPSVKSYFMGWHLLCLEMFYARQDLLCLSVDSINALQVTLKADPVTMFFHRRNPFMCLSTVGVKESRAVRWKLPELRPKHIKTLRDVYTVTMSPKDNFQVMIYNHMLIRAREGRHTVSSVMSIIQTLCGNKDDLRVTFYDALDVLEKNYHDVVIDQVDGDTIQLRDHYAADAYMCMALKDMFERDKTDARVEEMSNLYKSVCAGKASRIALMCDEQMAAMKMHIACPVLYVGGTGGSGKTRFLEHVSALYANKGKVYAMSFMASVADVLHKRLTYATVTTCHSFLFDHASRCPRVNKEARDAGKSCPIEEYEVLLVDEFSTMYNSLFSVSLHAFMQCSKLKRIIVTGDHRQLPSISEGNILKDFIKGLGWAFIDFRHNHRTNDKAFSLIRKNADAIADGRYSDMVFDSKVVTIVSPQEDTKEAYQECLYRELIERKYDQYQFHTVCRTNDMKSAMTHVLDGYYQKKQTLWSAIYVGSKFIVRKNDRELGIINNRILVLTDVWDEKTKSGTNYPPCGTEESIHIPQKQEKPGWDTSKIWRDSTELPVQKGYVRFIAFVPLEDIKELRSVLLLTKKIEARLVKAAATTNHCFQGREIDHFSFISKVYPCSFDTREGLYTASTRPRKSILYITSREALRKMCDNPEPARDTGLADMLERSLACYEERTMALVELIESKHTPGDNVYQVFSSDDGTCATSAKAKANEPTVSDLISKDKNTKPSGDEMSLDTAAADNPEPVRPRYAFPVIGVRRPPIIIKREPEHVAEKMQEKKPAEAQPEDSPDSRDKKPTAVAGVVQTKPAARQVAKPPKAVLKKPMAPVPEAVLKKPMLAIPKAVLKKPMIAIPKANTQQKHEHVEHPTQAATPNAPNLAPKKSVAASDQSPANAKKMVVKKVLTVTPRQGPNAETKNNPSITNEKKAGATHTITPLKRKHDMLPQDQ